MSMWRKNFRTRKMQTVMIFLVIMLSSALLTGAAGILFALEKPFYELAKECNTETARFYARNGKAETDKAIKNFQQLKEVNRVECIKYHFVKEEVKGNGEKIEAFLNLAEYKDAVFSKVPYLEGEQGVGKNLKDGECLLPACISNAYNLHSGDTLTVSFSEGEKQYEIMGVYTNPYSISKAFDSDILIGKLDLMVSANYMICIYAKDGVTGEDIETAYRLQHNGILGGSIYSLEDRIQGNLIAGNIIGAIFIAIGMVMLLVSILIIQFMIRNAMLLDAGKIAIYKVIGYSSWDILKMYLMFYFVLVSVSSWLGIASSVFLSNQVLKSIYENTGRTNGANVFLPGMVCYVIIVSLVLIITWKIVAKYEKRKPVITLSGNWENGIKKSRSYKGNYKLQFSPLGIAFRTIIRDKKGVIGVLITCIVTIFAMNFGVISLDVANEMKANNDYWLGIDKSDVVITMSEDTMLDEISSKLMNEERVDYILKSSYSNFINIKWEKGINITTMDAFLYEDFNKANLSIVQGRNPVNGKEIAIASKVATANNIKIGDYMELYVGDSNSVSFLVTGIYQTYYQLGESCRLTTKAYSENKFPFHYNNISIYLKDKEDQVEFIHDLKKNVGTDGVVMPRTEQFESIMDMIVTPQKKAVPLIILLVILLGSMNIFCIVMLKNANQHKVNGIYKCIGYSTFHLTQANMYYIGMVGGVSMMVALPLILFSYPKIMRASLSMFGFLVYPVTYNWLHIVIANIGILALFAVSTILSSRTLKNVNARELIKE